MQGPRSGRTRPPLDKSDPWRSPDVGFVVVELEIDVRAEHLQIGDQCVGFGDTSRVAVEVARVRFGIALDEIAGIRIVVGSLRQMVSGVSTGRS